MFECCFRNVISSPSFASLNTTNESVKEEPSIWEELQDPRKLAEEVIEGVKENFQSIKAFFQPIQDVFIESPELKVPIAFIAGCVYGAIENDPILLGGLYGAFCAVGAIASHYTIEYIGAELKLKASTISLIHSASFVLRTTIVLVVGIALAIFQTIGPWTIIGSALWLMWLLKGAYDLRCEEMEAELTSTTATTAVI